MNRSSFNCAASAAALLLLAGTAFGQAQGGTPIALAGAGQNGQYGPGLGANVFSATSFSGNGRVSVIDRNGDVVMIGAYAGGAGVWRRMAGAPANSNIALSGQPLPAPASSGTFNPSLTWASPFIDNSGNAMFWHQIAGNPSQINGFTSDGGDFRVSTTGAANFATRGANSGGSLPPPGGFGRPLPTDRTANPATQPQFTTVQSMMLMNRSGATLLNASWNETTGGGNGLYLGAAATGTYDTLTPIFLRGDLVDAPGYTGMAGDFVGGTPAFNDNGRAAFTLDVQSGTGTPVRTSSQNRGLTTNRSGSLEMLVLAATAPSWVPSGTILTSFGSISPSMNNANQIAMGMNLATGTGGVTAANDSIIGRFNVDNSVSLLREQANSGRQTAGGNNVLLGNLGTPLISHNGVIFAVSTGNSDSAGNSLTTATGSSALYNWSPETGTRVFALTGDTAPGTGGGQFTSFSATSRALNGNDQIAFIANLITTAGNPGGVTTSNDLCLYATDVAGNLILIAREGFALPGDPVAGRTVTAITMCTGINNTASNGEDGHGTCFNDAGQLVFNVTFSDTNTGVFVANVAPTPGAAAVLGLGALAGFRRRRV